jgi:hypothetical protein
MTSHTRRSLPYINMLSCYFYIRISLTSRTKFLGVFLENRYKIDVLPQLQPSHNSYPPQNVSLCEFIWKWNYKHEKYCKNLYYFYAEKNSNFLSKCWDGFSSSQNFSTKNIFGLHILSIISESKVRVLFLKHILLEHGWLS